MGALIESSASLKIMSQSEFPLRSRPLREAALAACRDAYYGHGKLEILPEFNVGSLDEIAVQEVITRPETLYELSAKDNTIAVVTDGTAVLGLERAGPRAAAPVMEGKPRCLSSRPALTRYPYA
ncbi:MAG: hypothetical protein WA851_06320 [Xanthobacteraceae bacterium]